jgi:hypothetical protein
MTEKRAQKFVKDELKAAHEARNMGLRGSTDFPERIMKKMRAIGMKVPR